MELHDKQVLFVKCLGELIRYAGEQGYELTLGEGNISNPRKGEINKQIKCPKCANLFLVNLTGFFVDRVHMQDSLHYQGLACDMNLFINGNYISDGGDPAFTNLGTYWESLDPGCRWGGRFKSVDSNHFSIEHNGRA